MFDDQVVLHMRDVTRYVRLSKTTIHRQIAKGLFPPPLHLTSKRRGWRKEDIDQWLKNLANTSNADSGGA